MGGERSGPATWCWTHVAQPLSTDGSALNNVIREVSRVAAPEGIASAVAASDNRPVSFPDASLLPVNFTAHLRHEYLTKAQVRLDAAAGAVGVRRNAVDRLYRPVARALDATSGPVIVHDGFYGAAGLDALARRHPDRPRFLYVHNALSRSYGRRELRRLLGLAQGIVCVSDATRRAITDRADDPALAARCTVVLNGVDHRRFSPTLPSPADAGADAGADGTPEEPPSLVFVGMVNPVKGPHVLMGALERLARRDVPFRATFVGSSTHAVDLPLSEYEQELHRRAEALAPRVAFQPFVPNTELPDLYRRHQILVVPSEFEDPCPLVLLEGMASGLATVATPRGGIPEQGADAVRYAPDEAVMADVLEELLRDPGVRRDRAEACRARACELTWERTFSLLRGVVGGPPPA